MTVQQSFKTNGNKIILKTLLLCISIIPFSLCAFQSAGDTLGYQMLFPRNGELCILCDAELQEDGIVILFKGRRVPIDNGEELKMFLADINGFFHKVQSEGALIDESAIPELPLRWGWFVFGLWITVALVSAAFCSNIALRKGLSAKKWFFIGLFTSILGLIYVLFKKIESDDTPPPGFNKMPGTESPVICPACGSYNHPSAKECSSCRSELTAVIESEIEKIGLK